jgi:hypothetical protein
VYGLGLGIMSLGILEATGIYNEYISDRALGGNIAFPSFLLLKYLCAATLILTL